MLILTSLREQVYDYMRAQMHSGRLLPGDTLNLNAISEELGISKTPLRDALIRLETEGFVEILPRRGVRVLDLTIEDVRNTYQIVGSLEASVLLDVFEQLGPDHIDHMDRLNEEMRDAVTGEDFDSYYTLNLDFHNVFLALSENEELKRLITPRKQRLYDFPRRGYLKEWELRNCDEHNLFIARLQAGDAPGSASVLRDVHWSFAVQEDYIRRFYSRVVRQIKAEQNLREQQAGT